MRAYNNQKKLYTEMFKGNFNGLITSFNDYDGTNYLSNECAIKNSLTIVESLKSSRLLSTYSHNEPLSSMLLHLSLFFVIEPNEYINKNIDQIKAQLSSISKDLNDEGKIKQFDIMLEQLLSNKF